MRQCVDRAGFGRTLPRLHSRLYLFCLFVCVLPSYTRLSLFTQRRHEPGSTPSTPSFVNIYRCHCTHWFSPRYRHRRCHRHSLRIAPVRHLILNMWTIPHHTINPPLRISLHLHHCSLSRFHETIYSDLRGLSICGHLCYPDTVHHHYVAHHLAMHSRYDLSPLSSLKQSMSSNDIVMSTTSYTSLLLFNDPGLLHATEYLCTHSKNQRRSSGSTPGVMP